MEVVLTLWYGESKYGPQKRRRNPQTRTDIDNTVATCLLSVIYSNYERTRHFYRACALTITTSYLGIHPSSGNREFKIRRLRTRATDKHATAHDQDQVTVHFSREALRLR